jgi:hypothetical protein
MDPFYLKKAPTTYQATIAMMTFITSTSGAKKLTLILNESLSWARELPLTALSLVVRLDANLFGSLGHNSGACEDRGTG